MGNKTVKLYRGETFFFPTFMWTYSKLGIEQRKDEILAVGRHNKQSNCTHTYTMEDDISDVMKNKAGLQRKGTTYMGEV